MPKKPTPAPAAPAAKPATAKNAAAVEWSTPVRKSVIPKATAASTAKPATAATPQTFGWHDIAVRAYFIAQSGTGGSEDDNWLRAEKELSDGKL